VEVTCPLYYIIEWKTLGRERIRPRRSNHRYDDEMAMANDNPENNGPSEEGSSDASDYLMTITWLSPEDLDGCTCVPGEAICGSFEGGIASPENFRPNSTFELVMHEIVGQFGPQDPLIQEVAEDVQDGMMPVVDLRNPLDRGVEVPESDIIGAFDVEHGRVKPDSYRVNDRHILFTEKGLVRLTPFLHRALIERLVKIARSYGDNDDENNKA
jgi:hypothetical protein